MDTVSFSKTKNNARLFFPHRIEFRNITVEGRKQGVRLIRIPNPHHYDLRRNGGYDGTQLHANSTILCDNVQLEKFTQEIADDDEQVHILIGGESATDYADARALYPKMRFTDCENISAYLGNCIASATFERCSLNTITAPNLRGEIVFTECRLQPDVKKVPEQFYILQSTLGTRFTNCTLHAPLVNGTMNPDLINRLGFIKINESVQHYHLNTALGNDVINHLKNSGTTLTPEFIAQLKLHHDLES